MIARRFSLALYRCIAVPFLVLSITVLCCCILIMPTVHIRRQVARYGVRICFALMGIRIVVYGRENLCDEQCIVVANHASDLDGLLLHAALPPRYDFVVKAGVKDWPLIGATMKRAGVIYLDRVNAQSATGTLRLLMKRLRNKESLAIFPEGTILPEPGLLAFRPGAFRLSAKARCAIQPVVMRGTRHVLADGQRYPTPGKVSICILEPQKSTSSSKVDVLALENTVRHNMLNVLGEPDCEHIFVEHKNP